MKPGKLLLFSLPLAVFLGLGYFFLQALDSDPSLLPSTRIDDQVPGFQLPTLADAGRMVSEAELRGPLLLNVWATWCPSCRAEHAVLLELLADFPQLLLLLPYRRERRFKGAH